MEKKICSISNNNSIRIVKNISKTFRKKNSEREDCNTKRVLKRYYGYEDEKIQRQKNDFMHFKDLVRTYVQIDESIKILEQKAVNK